MRLRLFARRRPRLRTILLLVNLLVLALPLAGIGVLRLYESALVRQTETELVAQGAFVAAAYRAMLNRHAAMSGVPVHYGNPLDPRWRPDPTAAWRPRPAVLDLARASVGPSAPAPQNLDAADPLAARIGAELTQVLRDAQTTTLAGMRVLDMRGVIVASTGGDTGLAMTNRHEVRRALRGEPVSLLRSREVVQPAPLSSISRGSRLRATVMTPVLYNGRVVAAVALSRTPRHILQAIYGKRTEIAVAAFVLLAAATGLALLTSFSISRPMHGLIVQARRAAAGEKGAMLPLPNPVTREVEVLSQRLADMARAMEARGEYIRTFAQHVSHEFKTPLTAINGAVELLEEHGDSMSVDERRRFFENLREDSARLSALVRRLLELARADMSSPGGEDRAELLRSLARVQRRFTEAGFRVDLEAAPAGEAWVPMAPETLESVFASVVDNARQHGARAVQAAVSVEQDGFEIALTDDGPGVSPANAARIFEPFFTTARDRGGTGLGLTVLRSLLSAHGGSVAYEARDPGSCFRLSIPRASPPG